MNACSGPILLHSSILCHIVEANFYLHNNTDSGAVKRIGGWRHPHSTKKDFTGFGGGALGDVINGTSATQCRHCRYDKRLKYTGSCSGITISLMSMRYTISTQTVISMQT